MTRNTQAQDRTSAAVGKLATLARELRQGKAFAITRLTIIKTPCGDPAAAARFGLYLVERVRRKANKRFKPLIGDAVREIKKYLGRPSARRSESLWGALNALERAQNEVEHQRWGDVRIICCREALLAEHALRCVTQPWASAYWGYRLAGWYAERYDGRYGTGLIPQSADAVDDIVRFWSRYLRGDVPRKRGGVRHTCPQARISLPRGGQK